MSLRALLGLAAPRTDKAAIERVKAWAKALLGVDPATTVVVNEIACNDPGCPGVETVVLVMEPGRKTRAAKIPKAIGDVTEGDVREALGAAPPSGA
ncbi:hypothetical protein [Salinarimonas soli]|uniref:Nitrate reductase n=1 Tax=Salinarimonas soli TaxID=1638099 RepID=A0A5B2VGY4_9HYPH|nr:hypothetical protein [Salinarimonas soli]KAA2237437.1 hypothetical protein F0L46_10605 [Salinarimonas soli]